MRTLLLLSFFLTTVLSAQIPNQGFESWVPSPWFPSPEAWETPNAENNPVVTQDTDAYEGNYAMRVNAVGVPLGAYGYAECILPIDYIPASLDFYVKTETEFGSLRVSISFYNDELFFNSFEWNNATTLTDWTFVSIPMVQNEPVLTHAVIRVEAIVGDFVAGDAWISVDAMGFEGPLNNHDKSVDDQLRLFPNPASESITVSGMAAGSFVRIINPAGQTVFESIATGSQMIADVKSLPKGLYILDIRGSDAYSASRKLVVR